MTDSDNKGEGYAVGYGKPPEHTRFQKGKSGNPKGRPKGHKNFKTDLREALEAKVPVSIEGKKKLVTKQRAVIESVIHKALQGNDRARAQLLSMIARNGEDEATAMPNAEMREKDLEILRRYEARLADKLKSELLKTVPETSDE